MALPKALRFCVLLLVICFTLNRPGFRHSVDVFFEEQGDATSSIPNSREKREILTNYTEYDFQLVITFFNLESIQMTLSNISFPVTINNTVEINSIETTTVCSPNVTGYQCTCEENFSWPYNNCITYGVCDAIIGDTCGCINGIPAAGQFCQLKSSQIVTTTARPPSTKTNVTTIPPTTPSQTYEIELVLELHIPLSGNTSDTLDVLRGALKNETILLSSLQSLNITELFLTTACYPNSTYGLQCQCESGFAWPCETCNSKTSCSSQICTCIYGLPSNNEFCQPITNNSTCPTPKDLVDMDVSVVLFIPSSSISFGIFSYVRSFLQNATFPIIVSQSLEVKEASFTTACYPNLTYGLQCQCESGFVWPCETCNNKTSCSSQMCTCIYGLPSNSEFCQPITNKSMCPTVTTVPSTTPSPTYGMAKQVVSKFADGWKIIAQCKMG